MLDSKVIAQTPIADVAKWLEFSLTEKTTKNNERMLIGSCPISKSGDNVFKVSPSRNRFICFCQSCKQLPKQGGDCIELVRRFRKLDNLKTAAQEIQAHFNGAGKADDNARPQQEVADGRKPFDFDPLAYVKTLDYEHEALKDLDILPETFITFQAGYSSKGLNRGRLAVAWHDLHGTIRMFIGMALDGTIPRYLAPKGSELPYWFNTHRLESDGEPVRILPDIVAVMQAAENGCENTICPLRPIEPLSLSALTVILKDKKLTMEV